MYRDQFESLNRGRLNWQTEEEVRLGWLTELQNKLAITFHAERGRSDADYNQVIIEFKNVGLFHHSETSPKFLEALEELSRYISAKAQEDNIDIQNYQGIAIDGESIAFVYMSQSGGVFHGPIMPLSPDSVQMVFEACHNSSRRSLTASNLIEDFGHGSITGGRLMQALSNALMSYLDARENNKVKMLYMEWKALYGQVADLSSFQVDSILRSIGFTCVCNAPDKLSRILFVIHTFDSIIIKLLAAEIVSHFPELTAYQDFAQNAISLDDQALVSTLDQDIEHSQLYNRANIHGFVEEPLFSWYIDVSTENTITDIAYEIINSLRDVLIKISFYQMEDLSHARTNDVLKQFYQNIVPQVLRKSLGEFYTPDWLVEVSLDKVVGQFDELKFLDPTCGSASFLLAIIKRIRANSQLSSGELLERIIQNVWGFDLNPLAVQTARVNYLIAISDLIAEVPGINIEIPILLADAIYAPSPEDNAGTSIVNYVIGSDIADLVITLPMELVQDRNRLDSIFTIMSEYVEQNMETAQMLNNLVAYHMVSNEEKEAWGDLLSTTYSHVLDLHRRNWNGIWFRIVRNYFWSATTGEFDVVVGNPPWVRWSKLPELYRSRVTPTCRRYDIFSNTPFYGGNELDISGLITYTVSDKWLKTGGQLIFLLTQTHFQSASSEGFRRFCIDGQNYLTPIEVEDLKELKPFPGAANKTVIFVAQKGENRPTFPINYTIWKSIYGLSKIIPEYATKQDVLNRTVREENEANPVQDSSSPWVILPHGEFAVCQKLIGTCTWAEGRKGITCDLNGVYFVNVVDVSHDRRLVRIETRPEAGRTNIGHRQKFWIEADLLYPVIKGAADIAPCCFNPNHELYAIVPNRGITPAYFAETQNVMVQENPRLFEYFHHFERQLRNRSTYKTRMPTAPYYAIYNVGGYTFAPWKVVWPEQPGNSGLPVAVVNTRTLRGIGERLVIPDHKIYFAGFDEASKAFYLCGLLLCSTVQRFILSFHIMLQVGDIFKHMKLPEYDPTNGQHFLLAKLVKEAHTTTDEINRQTLLEQISNIGNSIIENWNLL